MLPEPNKSAPAVSARGKERAIAGLRVWLDTTPSAPLYILVRRRSRTGKPTIAFLIATHQRTIEPITMEIAAALDLVYDQRQEGITVPDGDRASAIVVRLSVLLFGVSGRIGAEWI